MRKILVLLVIFAVSCAVETRRDELDGATGSQAPATEPSVKAESSAEVEEALQAKPEVPTKAAESVAKEETASIQDECIRSLEFLPGKFDADQVRQACQPVRKLVGCESHEGRRIFHYQKTGEHRNARRILVFGGVHGDEQPGASVARQWMARLSGIEPRNTWRIIPILNPDGIVRGTRTNSKKVDINRNFPSEDWETAALKYWKNVVRSNPRKYPGPSAASEPETQCAVKHIQTFEPELIIAIHTPLGVLDFDGPQVDFPKYHLPWIRLGHFPGSLGRYMWRDQSVPVLTVELRGNAFERFEQFDRLQDISGTVALRAQRAIRR